MNTALITTVMIAKYLPQYCLRDFSVENAPPCLIIVLFNVLFCKSIPKIKLTYLILPQM